MVQCQQQFAVKNRNETHNSRKNTHEKRRKSGENRDRPRGGVEFTN
jgi:hypothetical protein